MLTLEEIESSMQIEYELQLEALGAQALRDLLSDPAALRRLAPPHLDDAQVHGIAQMTLAELVARETPAPDARVPSEPSFPWLQVFTWFWTPLR